MASLFAEDDWGVKNGELILKNKGDDDFVYTITEITDSSLKLVGPLPLKNKISYNKKETNTFI